MVNELNKSEFEERVVHINRCAKVVKGGRRFSFSALVVVGNQDGKIGYGTGKANEVSEAIRKGTEAAFKNVRTVTILEGTIPHESKTKYGATYIFMRPASAGTGVISGASARAVLELAGVHNILTKVFGSTSPLNVVKATVKGLTEQKTKQQFAKLRQLA
ncbi:MAG: 30S ribosomal protein S5 [Fibrobacterales bacterium]